MPYQINTLTNHILEKQLSAYGSEAEWEVGGKHRSYSSLLLLDYRLSLSVLLKTCNAAAGHRKGEKSYFIPYMLLPLRKLVEWHCDILLPHLALWKSKAAGTEGDKSSLCKKFLYDIIPYFVEVFVQDGAQFVHDFPNHLMSRFLR
jgi:hypothetical protein